MDLNFSIHFGKSNSSEYTSAIEYAAMFERFTPIGHASKLNIIETNNQEVLAKYHLFQMLITAIGGIDSAGVTFRNKEIDPKGFDWNIKDIAECSLGYLKSEYKEEYCCDTNSNCWGCRHLNGIVLHHLASPFNNHAKYWYQFGTFSNKTTWVINKEEITQALLAIVEKKCIDFCPVFQYAFFRKFVAALPSSIDVSDTKNWGKIYLDKALSIGKQWEAVSIYHIISSSAKDGKTPGSEINPANSANNPAEPGKLSDNINMRNIPETSFADIGGIDDIIQSIRTVIELPIKRPELYAHMGIKPYRGNLVMGVKPGNGKTLIAKAIAHEVKAHFIPIGGPDFFNKSFGESEKNLRDIFDEARDLQPTIIFLDEVDSIAQTRISGENSKWYATVVNQLMSLMDGIEWFGNVTVLASTNRPDLLDPALLRPGRFDYKLEVKKPNVPGCKKILEIATRMMPLADDVDLFSFAEAVVGYSGAEITFIVKEAAMGAIRRTIDIKAILNDTNLDFDLSHLYVNQADFFNALLIMRWNTKYVNKTYSLKG